MVRYATMKREAAKKAGFTVQEVFGAGPAMPLSSTESTTESIEVEDPTEFSRHNFAISDSELNKKIIAQQAVVDDLRGKESRFRQDLRESEAKGHPSQRARVAIDRVTTEIETESASLIKLTNQRDRRGIKKPSKPELTGNAKKDKVKKSKERNERHALAIALMRDGKPEKEALAAAYDIIEKGQFSWSKLPSDIQESYKD
jgi:hypothetical protein